MSDLVSPAKPAKQMNDEMLSSMRPPTWRWHLLAFGLGAVVAWGLAAFTYQMMTGMNVTGKNRPVMWGFYITSFVFWVGLSHSGTMVSAILRLSEANWRRPILRAAEAMTVFSITVAGLFPFIHLGRNWVVHYFLPYPNQRGLWPNFRSALMWDVTAITTYLIGSTLFLYLGMLPDLAVARDRASGWRRKVYEVLAMGWRGSAKEWRVYHKASTLMAALIIVIRRAFHLEEYLTPLHFDNMGKLLLVICLLWSYAYFVDVNITWYAHEPIEWEVFSFMADKYTLLLVLMLFGNSVLPIATLCFKKLRRNIGLMLVVSLLINVCMFIERYLIIVPSLSHKNMPFIWHTYFPSWVELSVAAAAFAGFALLYTIFAKYFPIMAVTDVRELEVRKAHVPLGRAKLPVVAGEE